MAKYIKYKFYMFILDYMERSSNQLPKRTVYFAVSSEKLALGY